MNPSSTPPPSRLVQARQVVSLSREIVALGFTAVALAVTAWEAAGF